MADEYVVQATDTGSGHDHKIILPTFADQLWPKFDFLAAPSGMCKVVRFYINPNTGRLVVEYDDAPVP